MKITIDITEETAALIWKNHWGEKSTTSIEQIIDQVIGILAEQEAKDFRLNFPDSIESAKAEFSARFALEQPSQATPIPSSPRTGVESHLITDPARPDLFQHHEQHFSFPCSSCIHNTGPVERCQRCTHYAR